MEFTVPDQHRAEAEKLLKIVRQMETIVRTSPNAEQVERVKKDIARYREKISQMITGIDWKQYRAEDILNGIGGAAAVEDDRMSRGSGAVHSVIDKYPIQKASAHCNDPDVNFLGTVLLVIQKEYWPAISEQHCRLDFSNSAERDAIRQLLDGSKRNLKVLSETIEEYSLAEKQDFREQLLKMKNKQTRIFLFESNEALKTLVVFLRKINADIQKGSGAVLNKTELLKFNPKFEEATVLEGRTIAEGLSEFEEFISQALERLNLPQLKLKPQ